MAIRVSWGRMEPHFGGRGGRRGSAMAPLERAMVVSYRLFIVTVAIECLVSTCWCVDAVVYHQKFTTRPINDV